MKNNHFENIGQHSALNPDFAVLVPAAQNGGKHSLETICEAFRPLVLSQINKSYYDIIREDAESIAYCEIVRCVQEYKGDTYTYFAGYVKKMVVYALENAKRKELHVDFHEPATEEETLELFASEESEEKLVELLTQRAALKKLPAHYHRILGYYYWGGLSITEIADMMGISHQAVSKMKKNALKQLRELVKDE